MATDQRLLLLAPPSFEKFPGIPPKPVFTTFFAASKTILRTRFGTKQRHQLQNRLLSRLTIVEEHARNMEAKAYRPDDLQQVSTIQEKLDQCDSAITDLKALHQDLLTLVTTHLHSHAATKKSTVNTVVEKTWTPEEGEKEAATWKPKYMEIEQGEIKQNQTR